MAWQIYLIFKAKSSQNSEKKCQELKKTQTFKRMCNQILRLELTKIGILVISGIVKSSILLYCNEKG